MAWNNLFLKFGKLPGYALRRLRGPGGYILIYHNIGPETAYTRHLDITIDPQEFERKIIFLKKEYDVVPMSELLKDRFQPRQMAITFDDGYKSIKEFAWPILKRYDCPFRVYLNAASVRTGFHWLNELSYILAHSDQAELANFAQLALPNHHTKKPHKVEEYLEYFELPATLQEIKVRFQSFKLDPHDSIYLDASDIEQMAQSPLIEWGSHTTHHYPLHRLDDQQIKQEILGGHSAVQKILGPKLTGFALPFGGNNLRTNIIAEAVQSVDSWLVTATDQRIHWRKVGPLYEVQRIPVESTLDILAEKLKRQQW